MTPVPRRPVRFHAVRMVADAVPGRRGREAIEVVLPDGRVVRVPPGFAPGDLHQVLRVLTAEAGC